MPDGPIGFDLSHSISTLSRVHSLLRRIACGVSVRIAPFGWSRQAVGLGLHEKGISPPKQAMQAVEARLERDPKLPKWDVLIPPAYMV